jgi:hypothetical protein
MSPALVDHLPETPPAGGDLLVMTVDIIAGSIWAALLASATTMTTNARLRRSRSRLQRRAGLRRRSCLAVGATKRFAGRQLRSVAGGFLRANAARAVSSARQTSRASVVSRETTGSRHLAFSYAERLTTVAAGLDRLVISVDRVFTEKQEDATGPVAHVGKRSPRATAGRRSQPRAGAQ